MVTTVAKRYFIDTNTLVYARVPSSSFHTAALALLDELYSAGHDLWISRQVLREYAASISRPGVVSPTPGMNEVVTEVEDLAKRFRVAEDGPGVTVEWLTLLSQVPVAGKQVHDANIVATMLHWGIPTLVTQNLADFNRYVPRITLLPIIPPPPPPGVP